MYFIGLGKDVIGLIARNPFIRHALRLTCKQMRQWLPIDRNFVYKISVLSGLFNDERVMVRFIPILINRLYDYKIRLYNDYMNSQFARKRSYPDSLTLDCSKGVVAHTNGYKVHYLSSVLESIVGLLPSHVIHMALVEFLGIEYCTMLYSIISVCQTNSLFWMDCVIDHVQNMLFIRSRFFPRLFSQSPVLLMDESGIDWGYPKSLMSKNDRV
jgi:hypothetical protein